MSKFNLKEGDVFAIPLANDEYGFGQVVTPYNKKSGGFMIAIFDFKSSNFQSDTEHVCNSELLFLGLTFDAKLYHKDWILIGNYIGNIASIKMPYFCLGTPPDDIYMVNAMGEKVKLINQELFDQLTYRVEIAPIRYENALKAYYGLKEWNKEDYDKLLYVHAKKSHDIAMKYI